MLVWLDLETTGLKADQHNILEVAAIITTDDFQEVARIQRVVYYPLAARIVEMLDARVHYKYRDPMTREAVEHEKPDYGQLRHHCPDIGHIDPYVLAMHDKNGLWRDCVKGLALDTVDRELAAFVKTHAHATEEVVDEKTGEAKTKTITPQLAGSTISFDRGFIDRHLPRFAKTLHYRNVDVTSFNEVARRNWPELYAGRPRTDEKAAHRGLPDILTSLNTLRYYVNRLGPMAVGIEGNPNP